MLTHERLLELIRYDPDTGVLYHRLGRRGVRAGGVAGTVKKDGYIVITLDRKGFVAHRLAWLYVHGSEPRNQIDHINGVRNDNRIANLRDVSPREQQHNSGLSVANKSGFIGVSYLKARRKWKAQIRYHGKSHHLGEFQNILDAMNAYQQAKAAFHVLAPQEGRLSWERLHASSSQQSF